MIVKKKTVLLEYIHPHAVTPQGRVLDNHVSAYDDPHDEVSAEWAQLIERKQDK